MKKNVLYIFLRELKTRRNLIFLLGLKNTIKLAWVKTKIAKEIAKEKSWKLWEQKHEIILSYLNSSIAKFRNTEYCACKGVKYDVPSDTIWVFWWQGEKFMPEIVSVCYSQLKKNSNGHPVVLLTKGTICEYLKVPNIILDKVGKEMTFIAFSDYVRLNLLAIYGGLWIDSTFLLTRPLDDAIFNSQFFSIKNRPIDNDYVCKYRWAVNFMYVSPNSSYMYNIRNMFASYWENNSILIDYLLIDYCLELESRLNQDFNGYLQQLPITTEDSHEIRLNFNEPFNQQKWDKWLSTTSCFKLTYKGALNKYVDGKQTFYGHVIETFK